MRFASFVPCRRLVFASVCLGLLASAAGPLPALAQSATAPVAYVYVSYDSGQGRNYVKGFAAAPDGQLTVIPGSPFNANVSYMAVNGRYFFGSNILGQYVSSFQIQGNGSLLWLHSALVESPSAVDPYPCSVPGSLVLDHTGATLYRAQTVGGLCDNTQWQSLKVDPSTGRLNPIGTSSSTSFRDAPLTFTASNTFAYGSDCVNYEGFPTDTMHGYLRSGSGMLELGSMSMPVPTPANTSDFYCRSNPAADPFNHLGLVLTETNFNDPYGVSYPSQLASYSVDASGNLTTSSTAANMPATQVGSVSSTSMSPSGKLLAVAGSGGLQIFHFNGANPITQDTGLLTSDPISTVFWDNNQHLYAISGSTGRLYVFTVTPAQAMQAPGSPYSVPSPAYVIVQPRTDAAGN